MLLIRPAEKQYDAEELKTNTNDQRAKYKTTINVWGHWSPQELPPELKIHNTEQIKIQRLGTLVT